MRNRFSIALAFAGLVGWWACSSDDGTADPSRDSGTDAGGTISGGGAGGAGGTPVGGSGGTGGSGIDSGFGADPVWEGTTATATGCPVERLANATDVRVFNWEPCSWSPSDCEQAVFNTKLVGPEGGFIRTSIAQDDGTTVRLGLSFAEAFQPGLSKNLAVYALDSGEALDTFRAVGDNDVCRISGVSLWDKRFAFKLAPNNQLAHGGVVGALGSKDQPIGFTFASEPPGGSQGYYLGSDRWVWWWAPTYAYTSVSTLDGSDYKHFATTAQPNSLVFLGAPVSTGSTFLFSAFEGDDAGVAHGKIMWSDGIESPQVYLDPGTPDDRFGEPIFANGHLAWFRGIGIQDVNKFNSVELWASPYSPNPAELAPTKLTTLGSQSLPALATSGGWGFAAYPTFAPGTDDRELLIWDLAKATSKTHLLPEGYDLTVLLGISRTHLWVGASKFGQAPSIYLIRILRE
jgi:hypothetical protein